MPGYEYSLVSLMKSCTIFCGSLVLPAPSRKLQGALATGVVSTLSLFRATSPFPSLPSMGLFSRKKSSLTHRSDPQYPSASAEPKPIAKSKYNITKSPASSPETTIHVPEIEVNGENVEPLVQDFQDLYLPKAPYPPKVDRGGRSGDTRSIKSENYSVRLEDEVAPPPPEFAARRGYPLHSGNG